MQQLKNNETLEKILHFLKEIGIQTSFENIAEDKQFLPGLCINKNKVIIDLEKLKYPGDVLHEAGHIAVSTPQRRMLVDGKVGSEGDEDKSEEMMAIVWSYAAALHLQIDPHIVFHTDGYNGGGANLVENFREGSFFGVSMLQWIGLTYDKKIAEEKNEKPFPYMIKWVRE